MPAPAELENITDLKKIDLMIIGAQKAGTTSLKQYLGEHPSVETHPHKEFAYFINSQEYQSDIRTAYKKYFPDPDSTKKLVAKSAGLYTSEEGIRRLKNKFPDCQLVMVLRNPVERCYSGFMMESNYGHVSGGPDQLEEIVRAYQKGEADWRYNLFISMSLYSTHLEMIYRHFKREQVHLVLFDDLKKDPLAVCQKLFTLLGIDTAFHPNVEKRYNITRRTQSHTYARVLSRLLNNKNPIKRMFRQLLPGKTDYKVGEFLREINKSGKSMPTLPEHTRQFLLDYYKPYNKELEQLTGLDLSAWNS